MTEYRIVAVANTRGTLDEMFNGNLPKTPHPPEVQRELVLAQRLLDNRAAVLMALSAATSPRMGVEQIDMVKRLIRVLRS